ncbi:GtrA family protein [Arachidicoccus terrestris]|uniref:GtrA family protein n=1 Tax=Arachidicoccus terrestris TaxID=2875539 RepID=UPI001CC4F886|nr:GtrA family protein [Arachidicoccus terrestris]UAY55015.1 GtrA family protein [Arachidicoccus terrestris]
MAKKILQLNEKKKVSVMQFLKSELSSLSSSIIDLSVFTLCSVVFHFNIIVSTSAGVIVGGVVNFLMNRNFAFKSFEQKKSHQVARYLIVWCGSLLLNTYGTYVFVEKLGINKFVSRLGTGLIVRFAWNFPLLKYFVFKK